MRTMLNVVARHGRTRAVCNALARQLVEEYLIDLGGKDPADRDAPGGEDGHGADG